MVFKLKVFAMTVKITLYLKVTNLNISFAIPI